MRHECFTAKLAQIGVSAISRTFWPLPASFLTGASSAAGIGGQFTRNLSGFAGRCDCRCTEMKKHSPEEIRAKLGRAKRIGTAWSVTGGDMQRTRC